MEEAPRKIEDVREEIDQLDDQLVNLLNERAKRAIEIGHLKGQDQRPFFTPERERQIFEKLRDANPGPLNANQLHAIYREIISAARAAEKPLVVAFWGPEGTFTHMAALQTFGSSTTFYPCESIQDVFMAVEHGHADYGLSPIENSTAGVVPETLDMFPQTNVKICAETYVPIHHHLCSTMADLNAIKRVYAGPQPASQCRRWLRMTMPAAEIIEVVPTAKAAYRALEDGESAAIANTLGATTVGLPILVEHIEDNPQNKTRFIVLGYNEPAKTGGDKTSLMFNLRNRPGELYRALRCFDEENVNLSMIESRPAQRATFEYIFYCDCDGHRTDEKMQRAIANLRNYALESTILGSYVKADPLAG